MLEDALVGELEVLFAAEAFSKLTSAVGACGIFL